jgi:tripartite-type tricarboxylate transporter receptor subunit TctC
MNRIFVALIVMLAAAAGFIIAPPAQAQLPDRPIKIVVPFVAGGSSDVVATLFMADISSFCVNVSLMPSLPYDPLRDFKPVTTLFSFPSVLVVPANLEANSVAELIALAKSRPEGLAFGSQGMGSGGHLLGEMFATISGAKLVHVPYRGIAAAVVDLVAGRVSLIFASYLGVKSQIDSKALRILAVTSKQRLKALPDTPTMAELGLPEVDLDVWFGLVAPAGTPDSVVAALNGLFVKAMNTPEIVDKLTVQGTNVQTSTPAEFTGLIKADTARVAPVVKASGAAAK